jgi:thymidylate synthase (FAD)
MFSDIKVEYIDSLGEDLTVVNTARVSFDKWKVNEENISEKDIKLINYLAEHEHFLPFRHIQLQLRCSAPIWLARQLGKHQVGFSWSEVSRRYVDKNIEFYDMKEFRSRPENGIKQGSGGVHEESERINQIFTDIQHYCLDTYNILINMGLAPEQARAILPQNMMTSWIWTGSLLGYFNMWKLRSTEHAQVEARIFAEKVNTICLEKFPNAWTKLKEHG